MARAGADWDQRCFDRRLAEQTLTRSWSRLSEERSGRDCILQERDGGRYRLVERSRPGCSIGAVC